jgi:hypothetical protein
MCPAQSVVENTNDLSLVLLVEAHLSTSFCLRWLDGRLTLFGLEQVSSQLALSREGLTPGQKETPVCRQGVSVGHPRHEVYGLG